MKLHKQIDFHAFSQGNNDFFMIYDKIKFISKKYQSKIRDALNFAYYYHRNQSRHDKSPFIYHPVDATNILINYFLDNISKANSPPYDNPEKNITDAVCATILHDTVEDTEAEPGDIKENFGESIAFLVSGMTKPKKEGDPFKRERDYKDKFEAFILIDPKLIPIRISDVIQNSETLYVHRDEKINRIAHHMQDSYLELAYLLNPAAGHTLQENISYFLQPKNSLSRYACT